MLRMTLEVSVFSLQEMQGIRKFLSQKLKQNNLEGVLMVRSSKPGEGVYNITNIQLLCFGDESEGDYNDNYVHCVYFNYDEADDDEIRRWSF